MINLHYYYYFIISICKFLLIMTRRDLHLAVHQVLLYIILFSSRWMWNWPNSRQTNQMKTTWSYAKSCGCALVCTVWLWILCVQSSVRSPLQSCPLCVVWREFVCLCDCKINRDESEHSTEYGQFEGVYLQISWSAGLFRCYGFVDAFSFFVFCSPNSNKVMQFTYSFKTQHHKWFRSSLL